MSQNEALKYINSGNENLSKDNFDQAIVDFTKALELNPNDANVYYYRGLAHYGISVMRNDAPSIDRAIGDYNQALKLNPDYVEVYNARSGAYFGKNEFDKAIEDINHVIQLGTNDSFAYATRGVAYMMKEEFDRAIKDLETSLRMNPDQPDIRQHLEMARIMQKNPIQKNPM